MVANVDSRDICEYGSLDLSSSGGHLIVIQSSFTEMDYE